LIILKTANKADTTKNTMYNKEDVKNTSFLSIVVHNENTNGKAPISIALIAK
jgi:hypothetical protein